MGDNDQPPYREFETEIEGYKPPPMDPKAQSAAMKEAANARGGLREGEYVTAVPSNEAGPPGWTLVETRTPEGFDTSFDIYRMVSGDTATDSQSDGPTKTDAGNESSTEQAADAAPPGSDAAQDIEDNFSENTDSDGICETCIARGFTRGAAIGFAIGLLLSLLPTTWLALAVTALAALMVKGLIDLAKNWDSMSDGEKQEAVAEIVGGVVGGTLGPKVAPKLRPKGAPPPAAPLPPPQGVPAKPQIHAGKQGKHQPGHNNFQPGKSELTHPDPQGLVDRGSGTGVRHGNKEVVDFGEPIGNHVDPATGVKTPTSRGTIHHDTKGGAHIVPAKPTSKP